MLCAISSRSRFSSPAVVLAALAAGLMFTAASAAVIEFSDTEFPDQSWDMTTILVYGDGGYDSAAQVLEGGNPGAYREVSITVYDAPPYSGLVTFHRYVPGSYDPSQQGSIVSIDFHEDSCMFSGVGEGQASGAALRQGGVIYVTPRYGTLWGWMPHDLTGLTAADFAPWDQTGPHPDFGPAGGPIEFGFFRGNSTYSGGYTVVAGIDNWLMRLTTEAPTPVETTTWGRVKHLYD